RLSSEAYSPRPLGTETFPRSLGWLVGFGASQRARRAMTPLPVSDVFLTVAIMAVAFVIEIGLFILIGMF
ncbi:hypothetical protein, partial [Bradyrhizobium vignae]